MLATLCGQKQTGKPGRWLSCLCVQHTYIDCEASKKVCKPTQDHSNTAAVKLQGTAEDVRHANAYIMPDGALPG